MLIPVQCPRCDHPFRVDSRHAGKVGLCPNNACSSKVRIPGRVTSLNHEEPAGDRPIKASRTAKPARDRQAKETPKRTKAKPVRRTSETKQKRSTRETKSLPPRKNQRRTQPTKARTKRRKSTHRNTKRFPIGLLAGVVGVFSILAAGYFVLFSGSTPIESPIGNTLVAAEAAPVDHETWKEKIFPFLETHCFDCHGDNDGDAGLNLAVYTNAADVTDNRKVFEHIYRMINAEAMPPGDYDPQPSKEDRAIVATWLEDQLFNFDCSIIDDPGRPTIQRLNRAEYNNTIRDLVGVDFKPADDFPSDDVGEGFDNIGDVLSLSPILLEKYLKAAEDVVDRAVVSEDLSRPRTLIRSGNSLKAAGAARHGGDDFVVMYSAGEARAEFNLAATGDYVIRVQAKADQAGKELANMEFRINGDAVHSIDVPGKQKVGTFEFRTRIQQGKTRIAARFTNDKVIKKKDRNLYVSRIELIGPENAEEPEYPALHKRLIFATPGGNKSLRQAATEVLQPFARRAFRRSVTNDAVQKYVNLVDLTVNQNGGSYNEGVALAFQAILVSPHFLFRVEEDERPDDPASSHRVNDYELASRLSYFIWSSMPDDELLSLADRKQLNKEDVLLGQIRRMLKDKKARALTENFASQWLNLRGLEELTPDRDQFKTFNKRLKRDMVRETELLFESIVKNNRSITDFIDADYTFINERLAKHYNIPGVKGKNFQRVSLKGTGRAGVLTHASVLTLTSNPTRTSPVKRGKWILENLLNDAPPDPPPNVPDLDETAKENPEMSLREQLALHRESPTCASCHKTMDPLGFGFEGFNAVGQTRDMADGRPVDPSGELPSGETFSGAMELIQIVKKREEQFSRCLTEKMMIYALGRGLDYYDRCAVDGIYERMKQSNLQFASMVEGIVLSKPFRERRGEKPKKAN
ncbi:MAG: DUF1592 domain-containing protein [Planctomycetaceae bacterium]